MTRNIGLLIWWILLGAANLFVLPQISKTIYGLTWAMLLMCLFELAWPDIQKLFKKKPEASDEVKESGRPKD